MNIRIFACLIVFILVQGTYSTTLNKTSWLQAWLQKHPKLLDQFHSSVRITKPPQKLMYYTYPNQHFTVKSANVVGQIPTIDFIGYFESRVESDDVPQFRVKADIVGKVKFNLLFSQNQEEYTKPSSPQISRKDKEILEALKLIDKLFYDRMLQESVSKEKYVKAKLVEYSEITPLAFRSPEMEAAINVVVEYDFGNQKCYRKFSIVLEVSQEPPEITVQILKLSRF